MSIELTDAAASKICALVTEESNPGLALRLSVSGGGCAGFQYQFCLDDTHEQDDLIIEKNGAKLVIDSVSLSLLDGITVDYQDDLAAAMFVIKNPNATSACGCGNSFSL